MCVCVSGCEWVQATCIELLSQSSLEGADTNTLLSPSPPLSPSFSSSLLLFLRSQIPTDVRSEVFDNFSPSAEDLSDNVCTVVDVEVCTLCVCVCVCVC